MAKGIIMRTVCILALLYAFGCSQTERPTTTDSPAAQPASLITLDDLVYVDASSSDTQHPLVCGAGRDFPAGRELAFRNLHSREFVHGVFPEGVTPPGTLDGKLILHGHYQTMQNRGSFKKPKEDYQYFVVSSWEYKK